jgi:large-conductance mechanosensitive channel
MAKLLKELVAFLTKKDVLKVAVGLIVSSSALTLTKSFTDDLVIPALNPVLETLGGDKLGDMELKIFGAKLRIGKFIETMIRFLILMLCVLLVSKTLRGRK